MDNQRRRPGTIRAATVRYEPFTGETKKRRRVEKCGGILGPADMVRSSCLKSKRKAELPDRFRMVDQDFAAARARLVERDVVARGITDARVLTAMASVRRERFVPSDLAEFAYEDRPLPIGSGQTISQPYIVALMAEAAEIMPSDKVLEVGTGSGYGAAVLAHLASEVWTIERHRELAENASQQLESESIDNVQVVVGDGTMGWPEEAPFDAIVVTASGPGVPAALRDQLAEGGRLILPTGVESSGQSLLRIRRSEGEFESENLGAVRFVPLIGAQGWNRKRR